jgi:hypothetical protein
MPHPPWLQASRFNVFPTKSEKGFPSAYFVPELSDIAKAFDVTARGPKSR